MPLGLLTFISKPSITQLVSCMTIPNFLVTGLLPAGEHEATWEEVSNRFGGTPTRNTLLAGLLAACYALRTAKVTHLYLDGSFVTNKGHPGDWDACYSRNGLDYDALDKVLLDFSNKRAAQKKKYKGEAFIAESSATGIFGPPYKNFFQTCKHTGKPKGIIILDLSTLP
jgi:hypothetical protein